MKMVYEAMCSTELAWRRFGCVVRKFKIFFATTFVFSIPNAFYIVEGEKSPVNLENRIPASEHVTPKVGRKEKPKGMRATTFCGTSSRTMDNIQEAERYSNYPKAGAASCGDNPTGIMILTHS